MAGPALARRLTAAVAFLVALTLVATGCSGFGAGSQPYLVNYAQAAGLLGGLDPAESTEQIRDFARLGLAASLDLNRDQDVDNLYDSTPLRLPAFADLSAQPSGPGRTLFDGTTLHVLVPADDPHRSRTIGLAIDQHRADAGSDPAQVQVHTYRISAGSHQIELVAQDPQPTADARRDNGWHEARIDQQPGLTDFLADVDHLSRVDKRRGEIWAGGWSWPDTAGGKLSPDDVAVLQRGYLHPNGSLPGFSLDPEPATPADAHALAPSLSPAIAQAIGTGNWAGTGYSSAGDLHDAISAKLTQQQAGPAPGLPDDRTQLWALMQLLEGQPAYAQARYDGGLAGTEVGMTAEYTDMVAKDWVTGVGTGVPSKAVPGFVPAPKAATPASLCATTPQRESGRLWFGQADSGFAYTPTSVDIGDQATRLYSRANGANGTEIAPSYSFARGMNWWSEHFQQIADYEPQYNRLDELMRWSGALEWLARDHLELPATAGAGNLDFSAWYSQHNELREREPLTLVTLPSAKQQALLTTPSETFPNCGMLEVNGGVSLSDGLLRGDDQPTGTANLPPQMRRAGPTDPAGTHISAGTGTIVQVTRGNGGQVTTRRTIGVQRGPALSSITITPGAESSIPFGGYPFHSRDNAITKTVDAGDHSITIDVQLGAVSVGRVSAHEIQGSGSRPQADITFQPGSMSHIQTIADLIAKDPTHGIQQVTGYHYDYQQPNGNTVFRFDSGWIEVGRADVDPATVIDNGAVDVTTDQGVFHVASVTPKRLSAVDLEHLQPVKQLVVQGANVSVQVQPADHVYMDQATLLAAERAKSVAGAIRPGLKVKVVVAETTPTAGTGPADAGWSEADYSALGGGSGNGGNNGGSGGGSGGPGGGSGGGGLGADCVPSGGPGNGGPGAGGGCGLTYGDLIGLGGGIVLVCLSQAVQNQTTSPAPTGQDNAYQGWVCP